MPDTPTRYQSDEEDSGRWLGFPFRDGDIVVSTRSKSGTTWMQMICLLLTHQSPTLPAPLAELSPWLDHLTAPREQVYARLAAQRHRRVIKTHTPLDGIPLDPRAAYVVVARDPLDAAASLYHQGANIDWQRRSELTGKPVAAVRPAGPQPPLAQWLREWIDREVAPAEDLDSLSGVIWHLRDAWARRDEANVVLVHYDDLCRDLAGEMRRLAGRLGIEVPDQHWPELVKAATFDQMRARADDLVPDTKGIFKDRQAFFRRGGSGSGREALDPADLARYRARMAALLPPDLFTWLHREG